MNDTTNRRVSVDYVIMRQSRKTAAIKVEKDLKVVVKVPLFMKDSEVQDFILKYEDWVKETLNKKQSIKKNNDWILNKKIMYLGEYKEIDIQVVPYAKELIILKNQGIKVITSGDEKLMRKAWKIF
ncbi:YgjP-like metallopeptidase domain-containing protein [Cellulosilyticum ruminicola]|uniref:YgjP-like metallopeptidase domain-containing protein n=1 Tax=Cellulosilyticum ruminicola TaxID=425254 RepID=UPI0006D1C27E|nr:YgjP-like metallopeptidase domain-containing protein [Cellulosilyticum ruminicola]